MLPVELLQAARSRTGRDLAQRGAISVSNLVHDSDLQRSSTVGGGAVAYHQAIDVAGLIAFLHKSELIAALDREIDAEADDKAAMSHEARQKAEAEVMGDLLDTEMQEAGRCAGAHRAKVCRSSIVPTVTRSRSWDAVWSRTAREQRPRRLDHAIDYVGGRR